MDLSWFRVQTDTEELASRIRSSDIEFDHILCIARGGLVIGGLLSHHLGIRSISTAALKHYSGDNKLDSVDEICPPCGLDGHRFVLVVDDLVDTGATMSFVRENYDEASGLKTAVLYDKSEGKCEPDFYVESMPKDEWITFPWESGDE